MKIENEYGYIVVVDDDDFFLNSWKKRCDIRNVLLFKNPELFFNWFSFNREKLDEIECVILDYYFSGIPKNIVENNFIDILRKRGYKKLCLLSTDALIDSDELSYFDGFVEKGPISLDEIKIMFPK